MNRGRWMMKNERTCRKTREMKILACKQRKQRKGTDSGKKAGEAVNYVNYITLKMPVAIDKTNDEANLRESDETN